MQTIYRFLVKISSSTPRKESLKDDCWSSPELSAFWDNVALPVIILFCSTSAIPSIFLRENQKGSREKAGGREVQIKEKTSSL